MKKGSKQTMHHDMDHDAMKQGGMIDANHDGYVTRAEFDAGQKIMPGAH